jgi:6,7-dimethyl-8-ribityllumazine synthase
MSEEPEQRDDDERGWEADELERASENVLGGWPNAQLDDPPGDPAPAATLDESPEPPVAAPALAPETEPEPADEPVGPDVDEAALVETTGEHAPGELAVPPGYAVLEGEARGARRAVGIVVSRFNGEVTGGLLESALGELEERGVEPDSITVMPVPGAFELPLAAMALAKTRRFACIVALGCVIRGDTPHFDYVASEAASGLQLAAIETGVPVAFGVLTLDRPDQASPRLEKGAEAVRTALEMADLFANLRAAAAR